MRGAGQAATTILPIPLSAAASRVELSALWQLGFLSGDDIASICMRWLEEDLDRGNPDIATFAGRSGLTLREAGPGFQRALEALVGRVVERDEALLRALRLHLTAALTDGPLMDGVSLALDRFADISDRRLVRNPRRARDHPDGVYVAQNLGLEYLYGDFHALDDILDADPARRAAEEALVSELRKDVIELRDHLATILDATPKVG